MVAFEKTIFKSDIELSVYHISCFISVCPFVGLSKATFADNLHTVLSSPHYIAFILTSCVFWFNKNNVNNDNDLDNNDQINIFENNNNNDID